MTEYRLSPAAARDMEAIWRYTYQRWGIEQANRYIDLLTVTFAELAKSPRSAPACDHIRRDYRRRSVQHHLIYFKSTAYGIAIIRILHERMHAPRHLR